MSNYLSLLEGAVRAAVKQELACVKIKIRALRDREITAQNFERAASFRDALKVLDDATRDLATTSKRNAKSEHGGD